MCVYSWKFGTVVFLFSIRLRYSFSFTDIDDCDSSGPSPAPCQTPLPGNVSRHPPGPMSRGLRRWRVPVPVLSAGMTVQLMGII